jgi:hypothetical protein
MPKTSRLALVLKGHGFSRAVKMPARTAALAAEGMQAGENSFPQGLKPGSSFPHLVARLKPCPFKANAFSGLFRISTASFVFGCLLLGTVAWAQIPAAPAGLYRIAGTVVNAVTGEPVRQATVAALSTETSHTLQSARADNEGHFALQGLPAGKYQLTASKRGYRTAFYDDHEGFNSAIVTGEGQETESLLFRLPPEADLRVTVTDDGGEAVEKARILLFWRARNHGLDERLYEVDQAVTDDDGVRNFSNLAPGEYFVAVTAQPWYAMHKAGQRLGAEAGNALDVAYPVTFYDGATEEAAATPIVLEDGSHEEIAINLHAVPALHLLVQASRAQDGSIARPELRQSVFGTQISAENMEAPYQAQSGMVEFAGVAPGRYELAQGSPPRLVELDATASQEIDPNAGTPTVAVQGVLRTASGSALPEDLATILVWHDRAHPREPVRAPGSGGEFSFAAVPPGTWELWIASAGKMLPVLSTTSGGKTSTGNLVTVADRQLTLTGTVMAAETRVEGMVKKNGKAMAGAMVVLVPQNPEANLDRFARDQSDSDGSFSLRDVAPGRYTVVAIEDGWELEWSRPEVIGRYLPRGIGVTVTERTGKLLPLSEAVPVQSR